MEKTPEGHTSFGQSGTLSHATLHGAFSCDINGAFIHIIDPGQALAATVGGAGIRIVRQDTGKAGTLHQQLRKDPQLAAAA